MTDKYPNCTYLVKGDQGRALVPNSEVERWKEQGWEEDEDQSENPQKVVEEEEEEEEEDDSSDSDEA